MAGSPDPISPVDPSTEEMRLAIQVARMYFLEDRSKVAIADELGLSRFKVARLLDRARSEGIVTIKIASPDLLDADLSARLASHLGVPNVLVADPILPGSAIDDVAALAAAHLRSVVTADSVLGIAWSRATRALSEQLAGLPPCTVAQLCGVLPKPDREEHDVELVRRAARACGGKAVTFYAPLVLPDAATTKTLRRQPGIAEALALCDNLSVAVIAIGQWEPRSSTVYDYLPEPVAEAFSRRGVVAESCGLLFDADGAVIPDGLQERLLAVTEGQLRQTGHVIAVATEPERVNAIRSLSRSRLLTTLVTHRHVAERLLADGGAS